VAKITDRPGPATNASDAQSERRPATTRATIAINDRRAVTSEPLAGALRDSLA
jgi:hypothetical protein